MERAALGYTVVEVMIVLAISVVLFFSAITVFYSQRTSTNFSQAMQDVNSSIQHYANQVVTSSYPGSENYSCKVSGGRATLVSPATGAGSTCLFLGLAILALPGQTTLQIYTVLGNKDLYANGPCGGIGGTALTITCAQPEVAMLGGTPKLNGTYTLSGGATVVYSHVVVSGATTPNYDLVGFYNGLQSDTAAASSGTGALVLRGYNLQNASQLNNCIEENGVCGNKTVLNQWLLCFQDGGSSNKELLTINSAPGGISTKLSLGCP
jgi:type II secretory pathway pseudopilin PulG